MSDSFLPVPRRKFLSHLLAGTAACSALTMLPRNSMGCLPDEDQPLYQISLAQWSLHRTFFAKKLDPLDFAKVTREEFEIDAVEYVNQFFKDKATDQEYLSELQKRAADHGIQSLLIMIDGEGNLGDPNPQGRKQTVENHKKWVDAAKFLGCHSIRVNAGSSGSFEDQQKQAADGLRMLSEYAKPLGLSVIVENHGGLSSNGKWLAGTIAMVDMENCGTLPDFGNFTINYTTKEVYDRYQGVEELMPYAKAVSAKSHAFDAEGNETSTDYRRMMKIVLAAGYRGWVGIEWEGGTPDEYEGIRLTKKLLEKVRAELSA